MKKGYVMVLTPPTVVIEIKIHISDEFKENLIVSFSQCLSWIEWSRQGSKGRECGCVQSLPNVGRMVSDYHRLLQEMHLSNPDCYFNS